MPGFQFAASAALKIASLDLCADEYLLSFADPEQIASVSFLGRDPKETSLFVKGRDYPANDGTVEGILPFSPKILLTTRPLQSAEMVIAEKKGIRVVILPFATTPDEIAANVRTVGRLLHADQAAENWRRRYLRLRDGKPPVATKALWVGPGGLDAGQLGSGWLRIAGYQTVDAGSGESRIETALRARPQRLIVSNYRDEQYARGADWLSHPALKAQKIEKIRTDGRPWTCGGPPMLDEIERLRAER